MAPDAELARLKAEQDRAFQNKQSAYQMQDSAWQCRSKAREAMNRAFDEMQRYRAQKDSAKEDWLRVRSDNGPRIERLNAEQESAYQNMVSSFDNASAAHGRGDGASARSYADDGHAYKADSQAAVAERRRLVAEIRDAHDHFASTKPPFERARDRFHAAKDEFDKAKADHERKQEEFQRAKAEFKRAQDAFSKRLGTLKTGSKRRREDKREIAARAGVPEIYRDNVKISRDANGNINIYFGGRDGTPTGPDHGHYVMDRNGTVTYARDAYHDHGAQNFTEDKKREAEAEKRREQQKRLAYEAAGEVFSVVNQLVTGTPNSMIEELMTRQYTDYSQHVRQDEGMQRGNTARDAANDRANRGHENSLSEKPAGRTQPNRGGNKVSPVTKEVKPDPTSPPKAQPKRGNRKERGYPTGHPRARK